MKINLNVGTGFSHGFFGDILGSSEYVAFHKLLCFNLNMIRNKYKPKASDEGYRGMMQKLADNVGLYAQRSFKHYVDREIKLYKQKGTITVVEKLQQKYSISLRDAKYIHRLVRRRITSLERGIEKVKEFEHKQRLKRQRAVTVVALESKSSKPQKVPESLLAVTLEAVRGLAGEELKIKGEQVSLSEGFIYILTHENYSGWVKAGMTIDYEMRLAVYNTSDPLCRFEFKALRPVPRRREAEQFLLSRLADKAEEQRGEWFKMPLKEALDVFGASWL